MSNIVISQVYGGGGLSGATYQNDFIQLYNRSATKVDLNNWMVRYTSDTGNWLSTITSTNTTTLTDVSLQPGQYYLIQEDSSGANGTALPTADVTGAINLSGTSGKVKLVDNDSQTVDFIGYGKTLATPPPTLPYEGTGATPGLSKTTAALRKEGGLVDTDNNAADFTAGVPNPHNSSQFERRPTATDKTFSLAEDHTYTFSEADFGYHDADGDSLASVKITRLPIAGSLTLNNLAVQTGQIVSAATLNNLKLIPAANAYGSDYTAIQFTVNDGIADSEFTNQLIFNINSVNDAPTTADKVLTLVEDNNYVFKLADFDFQDLADNPVNTLKNIIVIRLPSAGVLQLNGVALTAMDLPNKAISVADLNSGKLTFQPAADGNGDSYASFDFKVQDDGGTADGGIDISTNTATMTFAVTTVNDAPVASGAATLAAITTNTSHPVGDTVSNLFSSHFSDAKDQVSGGSPANTLTGIAISNYTRDASKGLWQYHYDGLWTTLDNASSTEAILLNANDKLRFVPATNYSGAATALSANLIESDEVISGQTVDLTDATGSTTTISSATVALNTTINPPPAPPPPAADVGKTITVTASYTDGLSKTESVDSSATTAVTSAPVIVPPLVTPTLASSPSPTPTPVPAPIVDTPTAPTSVYEEPAPVVVAPVTPVIPPSFTVDGVIVQQTFTTLYGAEVGHFSTLPILSTRVEDYRTAHRQAADILLATVDKGAGVSLVLPTGVGFQADGVTSPQFINTAVSNFGDDIKAIMGVNSPAFAEGMRFLFDTTAGQTFFEQKIVLSYDHKTNINQPVIVDGTHTGSTAVLNTFVIDASALPKGSVLELKQVDFAVITGDVTVKLDPTPNTVHLASTQNPQTVFAQASDDALQVDSGSRLIHGGLDTDTVNVSGNLADYDIKQDFAVITLTSKINSTDIKTLVNVEKVQFVDQLQTFSFDDTIKAVTGAYHQMFGRQADLNGLQFWIDAFKNKGLSLGKMALFFMHSPEQLQKIGFDISQADISTQVEQFYQSFLGRAFDAEGKAFWVDAVSTGRLNLENLATTVIESGEMQNHYVAPEQWNFFL